MTDPVWPEGFREPRTGAPVVPRPPPNAPSPQGAPQTNVPTQADGQWPQGFRPPATTEHGTTTSPTPEPTHEPTWGEALQAQIPFSERWRRSAGQFGENIVKGVTAAAKAVKEDPLGVVTDVLDKATMFANPTAYFTKHPEVAPGVVTPFMGDETKKQFAEALGFDPSDVKNNAIIQQFVDRYGSVDKLKKTMYEDPLGFQMDLSMLMGGGEAAGAKLAAQGVKGADTAAKVAGTIARITDPTQLAIKGLPRVAGPLADKGLEAAIKKVAPGYMGWKSGIGADAMEQIRDIASASDAVPPPKGQPGNAQVRRNEFTEALNSKDLNEIGDKLVARGRQGLDEMRKQAGLGYQLNKDEWVNAGGRLDMSIIDNVEAQMRQSVHTPGGIDLLNGPQREAFRKMQEVIDEVRQRGPGGWRVEELDALKRRLNKIAVPLGDREMLRVRTALSNSVKDNILANAQGTKYHESMRNYQAAMDDIDELERSFALGKGKMDSTVLGKLQAAMRNNVASQYGSLRGSLELLEKEGRVNLKPYLLGMLTNSYLPRGITGPLRAAGSSIGEAAIGAAAFGPWGLTAPFVDLGLGSPHIGARASYGIGKMDLGPILKPWMYGATVTGRGYHDDHSQMRETNRARGGRIGYADGGGVSEDDVPMPAVRAQVSSWMPAAPKAVRFQTPQMQMPQLMSPPMVPTSNVKAPPTMGEQLGQFAKEYQEKFDKASEKKADDDLKTKLAELQALRAGVPGGGAPASGGAPNRSVVSYDPTFGLPQSDPLPGSYEERVRAAESGGKDTAVSSVGASGRYQFMPATAEGIRQAHPELNISANWRTNAEDQEKLMRAYTDQSREILRKILGRDPTGGELYTLHLFGHGGGPRVLGGLDKSIKEITTDAERAANPFLNSFATGRDLLNHFNRRFGGGS